MRILILASEWPPMSGGVAALSWEQAVGLASQGNEVRVVCLAPNQGESTQPQMEIPGLSVTPVVIKTRAILRLPALIRVAIKTTRDFHPDLVYCPAYRGFGLPTWFASRLGRVPYCMYFHGTELGTDGRGGPRRFLLRRCLRAASLILTNTHNTAHLVRQVDPDLPVPIQVIHPGAHLSPMTQQAHLNQAQALREAWFRQAGISEPEWGQTRVFIAVCRLHRGKGLGTAIEAFAKIRRSLPDQPLVYVLVGEGPHEQEFRDHAEAMGVGRQIIFAGAAAYGSTAPYFLAADAYLQPSQPEGPFLESYGIAFVEAQAAGLPCIGTNWGGIPEATRPGETAWLVPPRSVVRIAEAMERVLRLTPDERAMISHRGKAFALTRTWDEHVLRLNEMLGQQCPRRGRPQS
jgi:phosphatidylinositol alpha-1,6-mannosyltransferase